MPPEVAAKRLRSISTGITKKKKRQSAANTAGGEKRGGCRLGSLILLEEEKEGGRGKLQRRRKRNAYTKRIRSHVGGSPLKEGKREKSRICQ